MEPLITSERSSAGEDCLGTSSLRYTKETVRTMPEFAKALRAEMALDRCSIEVLATWSTSEDNATELNDFTMEFDDYAMESSSNLESTTTLRTNEVESLPTRDVPTLMPKEPELEQVSRSATIPQQIEDSTPEPDPPQLSTIPAGWEQAVSKANSQDEVRYYEGPEWIKLPEGGGWWKGNMTWI